MATTQQKLDEALDAKHRLITGSKAVSIGFGERKVEYTEATLGRLNAYIAELKAELAGTTRTRNRVRYVVPD